MFKTTISQAGVIVMALVCVTCLVRGRQAERAAAAAIAATWVASAAVQVRTIHHHAQPWILVLDLGFCAFAGAIMLLSTKQWPIWMFAYAALVVLTHAASAINPLTGQWDFFTAYYVWSYAVLASLAIGTVLEARPRAVAPFPPRRHSTSTRA